VFVTELSVVIFFCSYSRFEYKKCSSAQVNAMLGLKFVEYAIPGKKIKRKASKEDSDRDAN
jgi:hypothetical protein